MTISVAPARASAEAGGPGLPDVLADRQADLCPPSSISAGPRAALEVALLVEDAVVGQVDLAVDRLHGAVGEHRERVVDVVLALGEADERDDPLASRRRRGRAPRARRAGSAPSAAGPPAGSRSAPARGTARAGRRRARAGRSRRGSRARCRRCRRRPRSSGERDVQGRRSSGHARASSPRRGRASSREVLQLRVGGARRAQDAAATRARRRRRCPVCGRGSRRRRWRRAPGRTGR